MCSRNLYRLTRLDNLAVKEIMSEPRPLNDAEQYEARKNAKKGNQNDCFPAGTQISTPSGLRSIESLKKGDFVSSPSLKKRENTTCKILGIHENQDCLVWEITLENGKVIRTTRSHSFFDGSRWLRAVDLKISGQILTMDPISGRNYQKIKKSEETTSAEPVYNLIVEKNFTYLADGVAAHSFSYFRGPRMFYWTILGNLALLKEPSASKGQLRPIV